MDHRLLSRELVKSLLRVLLIVTLAGCSSGSSTASSDGGGDSDSGTGSNQDSGLGSVGADGGGGADSGSPRADGGSRDAGNPCVSNGNDCNVPARAYDLLDMLSLQGCTSGGAPECQSTGQFIEDVQYLGVRHYRDAFNASSPGQLQVLKALAQAGISMIAQIAMPGEGQSVVAVDIPTVIGEAHVWQGLAPNAIFALEGVNEPDGFGFFTYEGQPCGSQGNADSWAPCADLMRDYYKAVKADGSLSNLPFFGVTRVGNEWPNVGLMFTTVPNGTGTAWDGDTLQEYLTDHVYPAWQSEYWNGTKNELAACQTNDPAAGNAFLIQMHYDHVASFGQGYHGYASDADAKAQPHTVTEFGYATDSTQTSNWVNEDKKGRCIASGVLNGFQFGEKAVSIYSYIGDKGFGLFASPGQPQLSGQYLHALTTLLADTGASASSFAVTPLGYTLAGVTPSMGTQLLQKSSGEWWLAIWDNATNWDFDKSQPIAVGPTSVTLSMAGGSHTLTSYNIVKGTSAVQTVSSAKITVPVDDSVTLIQISR